MADEIRDGLVVSILYTLKLKDGEVVDFSEKDDPLDYLHGAENIVAGLEKALTGLKVGDKKEVAVSAAEGYGDYDPEDIEVVERKLMPVDFPLELGMTIAVGDDDGNIAEATVREIKGSKVTLDFNHPLAGQELFFSIEVVGIREATPEELEHGHVHGDDDDEDEFYDEDDEFEVDFDDELDGEYDEMLDDEDMEDDEEDLRKN